MYSVGAEYIETPQLKFSELVPYRKYPANTVSRVSKLVSFLMVNTWSSESMLSGLHTISSTVSVMDQIYHYFISTQSSPLDNSCSLFVRRQAEPLIEMTVAVQWLYTSHTSHEFPHMEVHLAR